MLASATAPCYLDALCEVRDHLRNGRTAEALVLLEKTTVEVPELPPFQVV